MLTFKRSPFLLSSQSASKSNNHLKMNICMHFSQVWTSGWSASTVHFVSHLHMGLSRSENVGGKYKQLSDQYNVKYKTRCHAILWNLLLMKSHLFSIFWSPPPHAFLPLLWHSPPPQISFAKRKRAWGFSAWSQTALYKYKWTLTLTVNLIMLFSLHHTIKSCIGHTQWLPVQVGVPFPFLKHFSARICLQRRYTWHSTFQLRTWERHDLEL